MAVLSNIQGKCATFRSKIAHVSGHLPPITLEEPQFTFAIGFADGVVMTGDPVVEKLEEMYTHIEKILRKADRQLAPFTT